MVRIRYVKTSFDKVLESSSTYKLANGQTVKVVLVGDNEFRIEEVGTGSEVAAGSSKRGSSVYLRRLAKNTLARLLGENGFEKEVRVKRSA